MAFDQERVQKILDFINHNKHRVNNAKDKLDIYEGELLPYVAAALQNELSPTAYERALKRIAPINMLPKVVNKLSTLYNNTVIRSPKEEDNKNYQEFIDYYVESFNLNEEGTASNRQLNLNKYTAWEIYISEDGDNKPKMRTLPANQFLVYSDNIEDPTQETVFIKILGPWNKDTGMFDEITNKPVYKEVIIYKLYDNDQIIVVDSEGELRPEFMQGNENGINPYGFIPFVYIRNAKYSLLPYEDTSDVPMTILVPLLLTDLNYATQFMSHSIIYAIDADIANLSGNPDSVWHVKSDESELENSPKNAKIGTIKPEVDIDKVIKLVQTQLALWLDSKNLKAQGIGNMDGNNLASGISKMIDEADTTQAVLAQTPIYRSAESEFWDKLIKMHNMWVQQGFLVNSDFNRTVDEFEVNTVFDEPQVLVDEQTRIETIRLKEDSKYISHRAAVQEANPEMSEEEIMNMMEEILQEEALRRTILMENEDERREQNGDNGTEERGNEGFRGSDPGNGSSEETQEEEQSEESTTQE